MKDAGHHQNRVQKKVLRSLQKAQITVSQLEQLIGEMELKSKQRYKIPGMDHTSCRSADCKKKSAGRIPVLRKHKQTVEVH